MRIRRPLIAGSVIGCALTLGMSQPGWATPVAASMSVTAEASLGGPPSTTNTSSDAWVTLLDPLNVTPSVTVLGDGGISLTVGGVGAASWGAGGNSGTVQFTGYGWTTTNPTGAQVPQELATLNSGGPDWTYQFTADGDGTFAMTFDVTGFENTFGLWGWNIGWDGPGGGEALINNPHGLKPDHSDDPTQSGSFTRSITGGDTYTVSLFNNANISGIFPDGFMDGTFEFNIRTTTPVPEPGSLTLLGAALAGLGILRRRKKA